MADTVVDIPGVGHVAFPDSMSSADIEAASSKLYKEHGGTVEPEQASAGQRFAEGVGSQLAGAVTGAAHAVMHPVDTLGAIVNSHIDQAKKAKQAYDEGRYTEAAGHLGGAALPVVGPAAAGIGERIAETGDIARGVGEGVGLIGTLEAPKVIPKAAAVTGDVARAGVDAAKTVISHPVTKAVGAGLVKHGSTVAGASVLGPAGAVIGSQVGEALSGAMKGAGKVAGKAAPVAADAADVVADLSSGRPMDAATYIEKLNSLAPDQRAQVIAARQSAVKGAAPAETPTELTQRVSAEHRAKYYGPEAPRTAAPDRVGPTPQTAPIVETAPAAPAGQPVSKPVLDPEAQSVRDQTGPAKPFNPSTAMTAARKAFDALGQPPAKGEISWAIEFIRRGATPEEAVAKVVQTRRATTASVDPAAELAARLGTPSISQMEQAVAARNATGRWQ